MVAWVDPNSCSVNNCPPTVLFSWLICKKAQQFYPSGEISLILPKIGMKIPTNIKKGLHFQTIDGKDPAFMIYMIAIKKQLYLFFFLSANRKYLPSCPSSNQVDSHWSRNNSTNHYSLTFIDKAKNSSTCNYVFDILVAMQHALILYIHTFRRTGVAIFGKLEGSVANAYYLVI